MIGDWHLRYPGVDLPLGYHTNPLTFPEPPSVSEAAIDASVENIPRGDGQLFGADRVRGTTIALTINALGEGPNRAQEAREHLDRLRTAWAFEQYRSTPAALSELVSDRGRSAFGRPRRITSNDVDAAAGIIYAAADFETVNPLWYGPEWTAEVALLPAESGGFVAPFVFPLSTTGHAERSSLFTVGGDTPTDHLILEVDGGAILNPVLEVVGVARFELALSMAYDGQLQLDGRPWARTTLLNGGSVAGTRSRQSTPLSDFRIPPGQHELVLRGQSAGNPRLRLRGRDAFTTH